MNRVPTKARACDGKSAKSRTRARQAPAIIAGIGPRPPRMPTRGIPTFPDAPTPHRVSRVLSGWGGPVITHVGMPLVGIRRGRAIHRNFAIRGEWVITHVGMPLVGIRRGRAIPRNRGIRVPGIHRNLAIRGDWVITYVGMPLVGIRLRDILNPIDLYRFQN